jgi:hypothetical protein
VCRPVTYSAHAVLEIGEVPGFAAHPSRT